MKKSMLLKQMVKRPLSLAVIATFATLCGASPGWAVALLGDAQSFAVTGAAGVTNVPTDATSVIGNLGVSPSASVTGFPAGTVSGGSIHLNDGPGPGTAINAQAGVLNARTALAGLPGSTGLPVIALGLNTLGSGGTVNDLTPGVYTFSSSASLLGTLTLDAGGAINPVFVFLIPTSLTVASDSSVVVDPGGVNGGRDAGIFWVTGTAATLGEDSAFAGNILAGSAITLDPGAQIACGRALAQTAVTFAGVSSTPRNNLVDALDCTGTAGEGSPIGSSGFSGGLEFTDAGQLVLIGATPVADTPEPATLALLGIGLLGFAPRLRRRRSGR